MTSLFAKILVAFVLCLGYANADLRVVTIDGPDSAHASTRATMFDLINNQGDFRYDALFENSATGEHKTKNMEFHATLASVRDELCTLEYTRSFSQDGLSLVEGTISLGLHDVVGSIVQSTADAMSASAATIDHSSWKVQSVTPPEFTLILDKSGGDHIYFMFSDRRDAQRASEALLGMARRCGAQTHENSAR
jgi:hypothetical protein